MPVSVWLSSLPHVCACSKSEGNLISWSSLLLCLHSSLLAIYSSCCPAVPGSVSVTVGYCPGLYSHLYNCVPVGLEWLCDSGCVAVSSFPLALAVSAASAALRGIVWWGGLSPGGTLQFELGPGKNWNDLMSWQFSAVLVLRKRLASFNCCLFSFCLWFCFSPWFGLIFV